MYTCKSCESNQPKSFTYCPDCGAKKISHRLTLRGVSSDLIGFLTNFDGPLWMTFRDMTIRPREVTMGYISGVRKTYITPVKYLVIALTLSGLFLFLFPDWVDVYEEGFRTGYSSGSIGEIDPDKAEFMNTVTNWFQKYMNIMGYTLIPILAIGSTLLLNSNPKLNFAEHLVINSYVYSHVAIITSFVLIIACYFSSAVYSLISFSIVPHLLLLIFLTKLSFNSSYLKSILMTLLSYMIWMILLTGIASVYSAAVLYK